MFILQPSMGWVAPWILVVCFNNKGIWIWIWFWLELTAPLTSQVWAAEEETGPSTSVWEGLHQLRQQVHLRTERTGELESDHTACEPSECGLIGLPSDGAANAGRRPSAGSSAQRCWGTAAGSTHPHLDRCRQKVTCTEDSRLTVRTVLRGEVWGGFPLSSSCSFCHLRENWK